MKEEQNQMIYSEMQKLIIFVRFNSSGNFTSNHLKYEFYDLIQLSTIFSPVALFNCSLSYKYNIIFLLGNNYYQSCKMKVILLLLSLIFLTFQNDLKFKYYFFQQKCFDVFFTQLNFFDFTCLKYTISKFLGYGLVYGSIIVKAPQIYKIYKAKSVFGVSFNSVILETFMNNMLISYNLNQNNDFSIFGQNVFFATSNLIIIFGFFKFSKENLKSQIYSFIFLILFSLPFLLQLLNDAVYDHILAASIMIFVFSRFAQIMEIHKNQSTGNLSFITCFLNFGGMAARLFTVWAELRDNIFFLVFNIIPFLINGLILVQFFMYWGKDRLQRQDKQGNNKQCCGDEQQKKILQRISNINDKGMLTIPKNGDLSNILKDSLSLH